MQKHWYNLKQITQEYALTECFNMPEQFTCLSLVKAKFPKVQPVCVPSSQQVCVWFWFFFNFFFLFQVLMTQIKDRKEQNDYITLQRPSAE